MMQKKTKLITFRLSDNDYESILASCRTEGINPSELVRRAIKWRMERRI